MRTRARHLLGGTCDKTYRAGVAQPVLILMEHGKKQGKKSCGMQQTTAAITSVAAVDEVRRKLYSHIKQRDDEGELRKKWKLWELDSQVEDWLALARFRKH